MRLAASLTVDRKMTSGFRAEFEKFWADTAGKVRAYMFCACASWTDTDDLVQDCYLRALRGWGQFNGRGSRQAWLFGIARRTRADWFRQKNRKGITVGLENANKPGVSLERPHTEQIESIWKALRRLDAEQSEVIHLRFAAGLSYVEIAKTLGIPVGTVRSRLHRGLKAIRKKIEEQENET